MNNAAEKSTIDTEAFTPQVRALCLNRCAAYGDPPCWKLPDLMDRCCEQPMHITPCADCFAGKAVDLGAL